MKNDVKRTQLKKINLRNERLRITNCYVVISQFMFLTILRRRRKFFKWIIIILMRDTSPKDALRKISKLNIIDQIWQGTLRIMFAFILIIRECECITISRIKSYFQYHQITWFHFTLWHWISLQICLLRGIHIREKRAMLF